MRRWSYACLWLVLIVGGCGWAATARVHPSTDNTPPANANRASSNVVDTRPLAPATPARAASTIPHQFTLVSPDQHHGATFTAVGLALSEEVDYVLQVTVDGQPVGRVEWFDPWNQPSPLLSWLDQGRALVAGRFLFDDTTGVTDLGPVLRKAFDIPAAQPVQPWSWDVAASRNQLAVLDKRADQACLVVIDLKARTWQTAACLPLAAFPPAEGFVPAVRWGAQGELYFTAAKAQHLAIFRWRAGQLQTMAVDAYLTGIRPDGGLLIAVKLATKGPQALQVLDLNGQMLAQASVASAPVAYWSKDGALLASYDLPAQRLNLWQLADGSLRRLAQVALPSQTGAMGISNVIIHSQSALQYLVWGIVTAADGTRQPLVRMTDVAIR